MNTNIPAHYSYRYVNQRYNKALYIVQHLPNSSSVQPTKEQKLELYSCYKQVSQGDVSTQRPGIFDVVGRAKWDAWKKLDGMSEMEAKHRYVEILLQVAMEAYKKPAGRGQAHQIIQSFAQMQPSGDSGDSSSEEKESDDDSSVESQDAEELAYLKQVEKSVPTNNRPIQRQPIRRQQRQHDRASSRASSQHSMRTAPTELRRQSQSSSAQSVHLRPVSSASSTNQRYEEESIDDSVNPWILHPSSRQYRIDNSRPASSVDNNNVYRSPLSTTSSSVTATQYNQHGYALGIRASEQQIVALGPATKRALESIQQEIEALNERINGLRKEIVDRDLSIRKSSASITPKRSPGLPEDGWKWVIKAAMKHAMMNLITASMLFLILYKSESPVAHVILGIIRKYWQKFKLHILISKMVV